MLNLSVRRLSGIIPVLLVLTFFVFILRAVAPVNQVAAIVGDNAPPAVIAATEHKLGLDRPFLAQYWTYLIGVLHGNLGDSSISQQPITTDLAARFPASLELVLMAFVIIVVLGTFMGLATAQGWRGSGAFRSLMIVVGSVPSFLLALIGMLFLYAELGWFPATGQTSYSNAPTGPTGLLVLDALLNGQLNVVGDALWHLVLPAFCIALRPSVSFGRILRSSLTDALRSDYIRTARVKGLGEKMILVRHALRNSLAPVLAVSGLEIASLFVSGIIVETIFAYPGIGLYTTQAISSGDFNAIAGVTLVLGTLYIVANCVVDLLQAIADPRVRL